MHRLLPIQTLLTPYNAQAPRKRKGAKHNSSLLVFYFSFLTLFPPAAYFLITSSTPMETERCIFTSKPLLAFHLFRLVDRCSVTRGAQWADWVSQRCSRIANLSLTLDIFACECCSVGKRGIEFIFPAALLIITYSFPSSCWMTHFPQQIESWCISIATFKCSSWCHTLYFC